MDSIKVLISPKDPLEARAALAGGASIIDVKNPAEGSLGAQLPSIIKAIRELVPRDVPVSATIGDVPNLPATCAQAALGVAVMGADYVKVGLKGPRSISDACAIMLAVVDTVTMYDSKKRVVAAAYSDSERAGTIDPMELPNIAASVGAKVILVDTAVKDGKSTFDYLSINQLIKLKTDAHNLNLLFALAGSLKMSHIKQIKSIGPDIVGIRGAVCESGDRLSGRIKVDLVKKFVDALKEA